MLPSIALHRDGPLAVLRFSLPRASVGLTNLGFDIISYLVDLSAHNIHFIPVREPCTCLERAKVKSGKGTYKILKQELDSESCDTQFPI